MNETLGAFVLELAFQMHAEGVRVIGTDAGGALYVQGPTWLRAVPMTEAMVAFLASKVSLVLQRLEANP